jgi:glutamate dehydrogenase (NAD(P)+)
MDQFPDAESLSNEELLEAPCDILAPCAVANQINENNANNLRCQIVVEGANAPTTIEADSILTARNILVMPDILANAAGVTVGYYEWVQGLVRLLWTEEETFKRLNEQVIRVCDKVFDPAKKQNMSARHAAMQLAIERIVEARRLRGLYP